MSTKKIVGVKPIHDVRPHTSLTQDVRIRLGDVFKMFDDDCDGLIETEDVGHVVRSFGLNPSQAELQLVIEQITRKNGRVCFEDLLSRVVLAMRNDEWSNDSVEQIHSAFQVITSNNYVQKDTLLQLLTSIGEPLNPQEVNQFLNHVSVRVNGDIDWVAYVKDTFDMFSSKE